MSILELDRSRPTLTKLQLVGSSGTVINHMLVEPHMLMELIAKLSLRLSEVTSPTTAGVLLRRVNNVLVEVEGKGEKMIAADQELEGFIKSYLPVE